MSSSNLRECAPVDISDADVMEAMKAMQGYIDITPADFREVYRIAYVFAQDRMMHALKAADVMTAPVHVVGTGQGFDRNRHPAGRKRYLGSPGGRIESGSSRWGDLRKGFF